MGKAGKHRKLPNHMPMGAWSGNGFWASQNTKGNVFGEANWMNDASFNLYFWKLKEIAVSRVEWKNLPPEIDQRFFEETEFFKGGALFSADEIMGYMVSAFAGGGELDIYNNPIQREIYTPNGYHRRASIEDSVIVWNNYNKLPDVWMVDYFANRIWQMDRTTDINVSAQKTPIIIRATKEMELTMKNLWKQYDGNEPVMFVGDNLDWDNNNISVLNTAAPFVADKVQLVKQKIWNECLTYLGVDTPIADKAEQLVSAEVRQNSSATAAYRAAYMKPREDAAKKINEMFGLDIQPMWNATVYEKALAMPTVTAAEQGAEASLSEEITENI